MKFFLPDHTKTQTIGNNIAEYILETPKGITSIFFFGDVGSGKTTCIQGISEKLGIHENIQSPTFSLSNEYYLPPNTKEIEMLSHIDMYRCKESCALSMPELMEKIEDPHTITCIEWAEHFPTAYIPNSRIEIHFFDHKKTSGREGEIHIFHNGESVDPSVILGEPQQ